MDEAKRIKRLKEMERLNGMPAHELKQSSSLMSGLVALFLIGLALIVGMTLAAAWQPEASEDFYPTPIATSAWNVTRELLPTPTLMPTPPPQPTPRTLATVAPAPVPTWTAVPSSTPTWTMVPTQTPVPTWTVPPTWTAAPTYTPYPTAVPPTWTPQPTWTPLPTWTPTAVAGTATPTRSTVFVPIVPTPDTTTINLLADEIASQRRQLWVGGGLLLALFAASLFLLGWVLFAANRPALAGAVRGLRRELAAIRQMLAVWVGPDGPPPATAPPSPTRQQLPPPVRPPIREARRVVESSESSRRVEPVQPVQLEPVGEVQLPLSKERAPNAEEQAYIRRRYAETGNLTAVCMECYDSKGGKVWAWVKSAVEGQGSQQKLDAQQEVGAQESQGQAAPPRPLQRRPLYVVSGQRRREV